MVQMKLAAAQGAPLPLRDLWQSLQSEGWDKAAFDRVVLELAASYRVTLLKHNFPGMLSDGDRADSSPRSQSRKEAMARASSELTDTGTRRISSSRRSELTTTSSSAISVLRRRISISGF